MDWFENADWRQLAGRERVTTPSKPDDSPEADQAKDGSTNDWDQDNPENLRLLLSFRAEDLNPEVYARQL